MIFIALIYSILSTNNAHATIQNSSISDREESSGYSWLFTSV